MASFPVCVGIGAGTDNHGDGQPRGVVPTQSRSPCARGRARGRTTMGTDNHVGVSLRNHVSRVRGDGRDLM